MPVITIRGQMGSEASKIARACAESLHLNYLDREIINRVAERLRRPRHSIIAKEILPITLSKRIAKAIENDFTRFGYSITTGPGQDNPFLDDLHYIKGLKSVFRELVKSDSIVINGRGSQFLLKDYPRVLHVLIVSPLETRVKRVMASLGLDEKAARNRIARYDNSRHRFIKKYFKAELEDPIHYDLVINTDRVSIEAATTMIVRAVSLKGRTLRKVRH
jgi:cytidylate kinase